MPGCEGSCDEFNPSHARRLLAKSSGIISILGIANGPFKLSLRIELIRHSRYSFASMI